MKLWAQTFKGLATIASFRSELCEHRRNLVLLSIGSIGLALLNLAKPLPLKWVIDGALFPAATSGDLSVAPRTVLIWGALAAAAITSLAALIEYWRALRIAEVGHGVTRTLRFSIFAHATHLSSRFHAQNKTGDLLVRLMGDVPILRSMLVESPIELFTRLILVVGTLGMLLFVAPLLTLIVCGVLPLIFLLTRWLSIQLTIAVRKQRRKEGALADFMHEALAANEVIRALGRGDHIVRGFARDNRRSARAGLKATRIAARITASVEGLLGLGVAIALFAGGLSVIDGSMTPGELVAFLSWIRSLLKPVRSASRHAERIAKGTASGERVRAILDTEPTVVSRPGAPEAPQRPTRLTFKDVSFRYDQASPWALSHIALEFTAGQLTALAGASGAGKSTLARLALRLDDPDRGGVALDGHDLRELELNSLRERIGLTLQEPILFGESIRANLLLGQPEASEAECWRALAASGAERFVRELPEGLDTQLGSAGSGLSGGQRRRLSLARTLLGERPVLIIDEPFAGLDAESATRVAEHLRAVAQTRLVIVIAHDFINLEHFDRVVLLDGGRVAGDGTHSELWSHSASYRRVMREQTGGAA